MGTLGRRTSMLLAAVVMIATTVIGPTEVAADPPPGAALTPSMTHGAPGDTVEVGVTGCGPMHDNVFQRVLVWLETAGADPVVVAYGESFGDGVVMLTLPDWYEPGPARLMADCFELRLGEDVPPTFVFSYPAVDFELMPGDGPARQTMTLGRTSVEEGQVIPVELTGCDPGGDYDNASALVAEGADMAGPWASERTVASAYGKSGADGTARFELAVLGDGQGLEPGPHVVVGRCQQQPGARFIYRAQAIMITAANPATGTLGLDYRASDGQVDNTGEGCTGGALVTLRIMSDLGMGEETAGPEPSARVVDEIVVTPGPDGSWSHVWDLPPQGAVAASVSADCGDPLADGFRYRSGHLTLGGTNRVDRISPTTSPTGGPVVVHVTGDCTETVTVDLVDDDGEVQATGSTRLSGTFGSVDLTAPPEAGRYAAAVRCVLGRSDGPTLDVFDPGPPRSPDPVPPAPPATGWPSAGPVEHFTGRIGPIALPAEHDMGSMEGNARPPADIVPDLPRPEGEFAIRSIHYDLVDAGTGRSVPTEDAHLHHFVMGKIDDQNSACPNGTFGSPGEVVGAVGQERSQIDFPDPYGLVVGATDPWGGMYELMNLGHEAREVYLTYELTIQRDVSKIRPLESYFFSAIGCSWFEWTIDGSGTRDVQSTYVTMEEDGLLVAGGGHVHSGGEASELYDDRGRLLCRSELHEGEGGGHGGHGELSAEPAAVTEPMTPTTEGGVEPTIPPEFYPDDPPTGPISLCPSINQPVQAGERLRFDAIYTNERPRSGVMGIGLYFVWEGGGPADPVAGPVVPPGGVPPGAKPPAAEPGAPPRAPAAKPVPGRARFTG